MTFTVNQTTDTGTEPINGVCDSNAGMAGNQCELRGAIEEANATTVSDTITFSSLFNGTVGTSTIALTGDLPAVSEEATINGGNCAASGTAKPCVGLDANGALFPLYVSANGVDIRGLAVTDASNAVFITGNNATVKGSWLGLALDETLDGSSFGIVIDEANSAAVGGTTGADRNVIADNFTGVNIFKGDNNKVRGNYFGTLADGTTSAPNADMNIRIFGDDSPADDAVGNVIGASISSAGVSTTTCDKGCNVIATSGVHGIDLGQDVAGFAGAQDTTIKGNFVGLDKTGAAALKNTSSGIFVGDSDGTTIGGDTSAERNFITGGEIGINQDDSSQSLRVNRNFIGLRSSGMAAVDPPTDSGIVMQSESANASTATGNRLAAAGVGIVTRGVGDRVVRNKFGLRKDGGDLPDAGVRAISVEGGDSGMIGEPGAGNTIGNINGIAIEIQDAASTGGDDNKVQGNFIGVDSAGVAHPNAGGIRVIGDSANAADDNLIGGDSSAAENVISNCSGTPGDAISVGGGAVQPSGIEIRRNRGKNCGSPMSTDLFIELGPNGFGNSLGPNGAISAPTITDVDPGDVTRTHVEGAGAQPTATIYIFRTSAPATFSPNGINAFVKKVTADGSGNWSANFAQIPTGQNLTALQLDTSGSTTADGSSELALAVAP